MTVQNLWELCENWTLFSNVRIYCAENRLCYDYTYYKEVLDVWGNNTVMHFGCDSNNDIIDIDVGGKL